MTALPSRWSLSIPPSSCGRDTAFPTLRFQVKEGVAAAVTVRNGDDWTTYKREAR